jgi:outer membrane receptor protein involved in Fe transport
VKRILFITLVIFSSVMLLFSLALAGTTGKITGRVVDKSTGDPLPMANIVIQGTTMGASTDLYGHFTILRVPPGTYSVKATMMGFESVVMTEVKVQVDLTTTTNFQMPPTVLDIGGEITVVAGRPIIQKDITFSSHRLSEESIRNMPQVTTVRDIVARQPGVVGEGLHINVRGGRTGEVLYVVDGMSVRDPLATQATRTTQEQVMDFSSNPVDELAGRSGGMSIPANAIAEVEVITGGFSAEYGNALSGIVNVVTREGGPRFTGRALYMTDDIGQGTFKTPYGNGSGLRKYSHNMDRFELSFGGPEPITSYLLPSLGVRVPVKMSYFVSATGKFTNITSAFDLAYYAPTGEDRSDEMRDKIFGIPLPFEYGNRMDNQYNSMSNLTMRFSPSFKVTLSYLTDNTWYDEYNHAFKNIPENFWQREEDNSNLLVKINHALSPSTFYEFLVGHYHTDYLLSPGGMTPPEVYELWDSLISPIGDDRGANYQDYDRDGFYDAGYPDRGTYHNRTSDKWTAKIDLTSQVHHNHQLKTGIEMNHYRMYKAEIKYPSSYHPDEILDEGMWPEYGIFRDFYTRWPTTGAMYIQDKIEYETLIVNVGLRYDFYTPGKQVNEKVEEGETVPFTGDDGLKFKHTFNPRLGVSHPITDRDILYFQFGRFSQEVDWRFLFMQDTQTSGAYKLYGNPNLSSEETTQYEVGVKHAFNDEIRLELTAFYKDYQGLLNAETRGRLNLTYSVYVNRDYGSARGFEVSLQKRYSNYTSGFLSYTYSYAMGKSSSYRQGYDYSYRGSVIPIREWPLDWDVRHSANVNFDFRIPKGQSPTVFGVKLADDWGINFIWRIESGKPYTPGGLSATQFTTKNSARTPYRNWLNMRANKNFRFAGLRYQVLLEINNIFNRRNVRAINSETGDTIGLGREQDINPTAYGTGRGIIFGLAVEW